MIIPFSEDQIEDCVSQFVRDSEVHELADEGPIWSAGDNMDKPKSTPFEIPMELKAFLPPEILEEIVSYTNGYVCCVLGMDLSLSRIRQCMFLSGGPGRVLSEILSRGGDLRALLTIKDHVPPEIAIAKAVETGDKKMLDTTIAIWGTNVGDGGLRLAMKMGMSHGIDAVISTVVGTVRHRNAYYVSKSRYDDVDRTIDRPYDEVFMVPDKIRLQGILDQCSPDAYPVVLARCVTTQEFLGVFATWDDATRQTCGNLIGTRKLPGDAVVEISSMGLGSTSGLLAEGLTKEQIMRTRHWPGGKLRDFFSYGFTREIPTYIIVPMVGTIIKEGMEEDLLEYLERHPYALDDDHVSGLISSLGYEKALRGRWGKILSRPLSRKAYDITVQLANMDLVEAGVHIIEMGYDMTPEEDFYRQLPCAYVMRLEGMEVNAMIPYTIEEVLWMCTMAGNYHDVVRIDGSSGVGVEDGRLYIPTVVDVNPGDASVDEWMTNVDVCLCAMSYPGF